MSRIHFILANTNISTQEEPKPHFHDMGSMKEQDCHLQGTPSPELVLPAQTRSSSL
jgi:hypothetical protein